MTKAELDSLPPNAEVIVARVSHIWAAEGVWTSRAKHLNEVGTLRKGSYKESTLYGEYVILNFYKNDKLYDFTEFPLSCLDVVNLLVEDTEIIL